MTTAASAVRARSERLSLTVSADMLAVGVLLLLMGGLAAATWATWGDPGRDTGYDLVAGARVAHGQLPYVDFVYYYGPLAPFVLGFAMWAGGAGLGAAVPLGLALSAAIVVATYVLARTQVGPVGAALAGALVAAVAASPTNLSYVLPHTESAPLGLLCSLGFLIGLARYAERGNRVWLAAAGIAAGLVALTRPEFELGVVLAGVLWLVTRRRASAPFAREAALLAGPAVGIPAAVYGAFLSQVTLHRLLFKNLYPLDVLRAGGNHILRSQAPLTVHSLGRLVVYLLLYGAGTAVLLLLARALERTRRKQAFGAVAVMAAAMVALAVGRPETLRYYLEFVFGWLPLGALLGVGVLVLAMVRRRTLPPRDLTLGAALVLLAVVAAKNYNGFFLLAPRAQPAVYAAPLVAVALVRLHLGELARSRATVVAGVLWLAFLATACVGLTANDARARSVRVSGPGGTIKVSPGEAPLYQAALAAIESRTRPSESVLVAPQLSLLYTLTGRRDPLSQISLLPGALANPEAERQAIARLEQAGVRVAVTDRHYLTEYGQTAFGRSFDRILAVWIRSSFVHVATLRAPSASVSHALDIWVRRSV